MLDPWIIEEIRRREDERRRIQEERVLEIPLEPIYESEPPRHKDRDQGDRGVVVIDL